MALILNGTTIPYTGTVTYNGSTVEKVVYNGTAVWAKTLAVTGVVPTVAFFSPRPINNYHQAKITLNKNIPTTIRATLYAVFNEDYDNLLYCDQGTWDASSSLTYTLQGNPNNPSDYTLSVQVRVMLESYVSTTGRYEYFAGGAPYVDGNYGTNNINDAYSFTVTSPTSFTAYYNL